MLADNTSFDFSDVQGIVRHGHGQLQSTSLLLMRIRDATAAGRWLGQVSVTSAERISPAPTRALQVAFTADGLRQLGLDETLLAQFSDEFRAGMVAGNRSRRLGDVGDNAPEKWHWGGQPDSTPHLVLMLYGQADDFGDYQQSILEDELFKSAFSVDHTLTADREPTTEPFGFPDGISQPYIDWDRKQTADIHRRDTYSNLLSLGEVLLGYANEYGQYSDRPLLKEDVHALATTLPGAEDRPGYRDLGRNGSYMVVRQLAQNVPRFWQFADQIAGGDPGARDKFAEALVGRKLDGNPLVQMAPRPIEGIPEKHQENNNFNFDNDPRGQVCPVASHVRRANPRTGDFPRGVRSMISRLLRILGFAGDSRDLDLVASARFHRILRRGRPYGPPMSREEALRTESGKGEPQGLHFICLSANIARQFEFVQNAWVVNSKFAGLQNESDPLLGNGAALIDGTPTDNFSQPQISGLRRCTGGTPQFVTVRGGAYFFLPGIRALRFLASLPGTVESKVDKQSDGTGEVANEVKGGGEPPVTGVEPADGGGQA